MASFLLLPMTLIVPLLLLLALSLHPGIRKTCKRINGFDDFRDDLKYFFEAACKQVIAFLKAFFERPNKSAPRLFFTALPLEIRRKVYSHLLLTTSITSRCVALKPRQKPRRKNYPCHDYHAVGPHLGLDARMLRTCRQMYDDGLPMLYGKNHFTFKDIEDATFFAMHGLPQYCCELSFSGHFLYLAPSDKPHFSSPYSSTLTQQ